MRRSEEDAKKLICHLTMATPTPCKCIGTACQAWEWAFGQPEIGDTSDKSLCKVHSDGNGQSARDDQLKRYTDNGWKLTEPLDPACNMHKFKFVGPKKGYCGAIHLDVNVEVN